MKRGLLSIAMLLFLAAASVQAQEVYNVHTRRVKPDKKQLTEFNKYESSFTKEDSRKHAKELKEKERKARIRGKITEAKTKRYNILAKRELKKRGLMARKERPLVSFR